VAQRRAARRFRTAISLPRHCHAERENEGTGGSRREQTGTRRRASQCGHCRIANQLLISICARSVRVPPLALTQTPLLPMRISTGISATERRGESSPPFAQRTDADRGASLNAASNLCQHQRILVAHVLSYDKTLDMPSSICGWSSLASDSGRRMWRDARRTRSVTEALLTPARPNMHSSMHSTSPQERTERVTAPKDTDGVGSTTGAAQAAHASNPVGACSGRSRARTVPHP